MKNSPIKQTVFDGEAISRLAVFGGLFLILGSYTNSLVVWIYNYVSNNEV